jgi:hypothetical protein
MTDTEILIDIVNLLEKEEKTTENMLDSSVNSLIESGKINNRISCVKYKEKLKLIKSLKSRLLLNKSKQFIP